MTNSLFKPPLSTADLKAIQERNPENADVRALLWEVKRLRATMLHVEQLQQMLGDMGSGITGQVLRLVREDLAGEPVVMDQRKLESGDEPDE